MNDQQPSKFPFFSFEYLISSHGASVSSSVPVGDCQSRKTTNIFVITAHYLTLIIIIILIRDHHHCHNHDDDDDDDDNDRQAFW